MPSIKKEMLTRPASPSKPSKADQVVIKQGPSGPPGPGPDEPPASIMRLLDEIDRQLGVLRDRERARPEDLRSAVELVAALRARVETMGD